MAGAVTVTMHPIAPGPHGPNPHPGSYPAQYGAPHAPGHAAQAPSGGRRPGLIVLGVVLLLGGGVSAFSCTVWQESLEYSQKKASELKRERSDRVDAERFDKSAIDDTQKELEQTRGFVAENELYRNATGGGGALGLLGGVALIAFGARKRKA